VLTGYLLSASVATPIAGKLGDLYGKGRVLTWVMLLFAAGSAVCALAGSIELVIVGRVIQGVAGGVFPLSFGIIRDTFPPERVAGGIGLMSAIFGIGGGIGLPLSGVVVDNMHLGWLFWIGLIALPAALAAHLVVPPSPPRPRTRVDWAGAALLSSALVSVLLGVTRANDWGWTSPGIVALVGGGVVLALLWLAVESRVPEPLIDLRVLRRRAVATTNLVGLLVGFAMFSSFLLIPQFAQAPEQTGYGFGLSVTESGLILVPSALVQLLVGPLAGRMGSRLGFRVTLAIGTALAMVAFLVLALEHGHPWQFIVGGIATGINTIMRTVGGAFGAAVATAILTADTLAGSPVPTEHAYTVAFLVSAGGALLALAAALCVPSRRDPGGDGGARVAAGTEGAQPPHGSTPRLGPPDARGAGARG
jgi:MFS family permease